MDVSFQSIDLVPLAEASMHFELKVHASAENDWVIGPGSERMLQSTGTTANQGFEMSSAMKFCYYSKNQIRRTLSSSPSTPDGRFEEFKRKFRRSGSLGIPFVPEEDIKELFGKK
ncbi:hypothetical protein OSTOST_18556, partial [Ostertagia ostertagi]